MVGGWRYFFIVESYAFGLYYCLGFTQTLKVAQKYCFRLCKISVCSDNILPSLSLQQFGMVDWCLLKNWASLKNFRVSFLSFSSSVYLILLFIQPLFFLLQTLLASVLFVSYISRLAVVLACKYFFLASFFCVITSLHSSSHRSFLGAVFCICILSLAASVIVCLMCAHSSSISFLVIYATHMHMSTQT